MSMRARLAALERIVAKRGLDRSNECPTCGGGGDGRSDTSRMLYLGSDPPGTCDACGGPLGQDGRGLACGWNWTRWEGEWTPRE